MLKPKSKSLMTSGYEQDPLKQHIQILIQKSEEMLKEKLQRQHEKQAKVQTVQKMFVEWADRKENSIKQKLQKSNKNKEEHINKIVKKCKEHEKYLDQKLKSHKSKEKDSIKQAWKKIQHYQRSTEHFYQSKYDQKEKSATKLANQCLTQSQTIQQKYLPLDKRQNQKQYLSVSYTNGNLSKQNNNASKEYWAEFNQSVKQVKHPIVINHRIQLTNQQEKDKGGKTHKLKQILVRFKQIAAEQQNAKVQQLGMRLEKIEKTRTRKIQLIKKKKCTREKTFGDFRIEKKEKKKQGRSQRINSQSMIRQKKARDWSDANKQKRNQLLQMQIKDGSDYLQSQKIKYLKTTLAKQINDCAIEKKLYFQRLNH